MASTGRIVKIIRERDKTFTVMSSVTGKQSKKTLEELIEYVTAEYKEEK